MSICLVRKTLLCFCAISAAAFGQATGQLGGRVNDKSGAAVPTADVTVVNAGTGVERKFQTNEPGDYTAPFLPPGNYTISIAKQGFRLAKREGVRLEVNQVARPDFTLEVGAVPETVEVTGSIPLIESDTSSIGQVIEQKAVEDLPLNDRNFVQLAIQGLLAQRALAHAVPC